MKKQAKIVANWRGCKLKGGQVDLLILWLLVTNGLLDMPYVNERVFRNLLEISFKMNKGEITQNEYMAIIRELTKEGDKNE